MSSDYLAYRNAMAALRSRVASPYGTQQVTVGDENGNITLGEDTIWIMHEGRSTLARDFTRKTRLLGETVTVKPMTTFPGVHMWKVVDTVSSPGELVVGVWAWLNIGASTRSMLFKWNGSSWVHLTMNWQLADTRPTWIYQLPGTDRLFAGAARNLGPSYQFQGYNFWYDLPSQAQNNILDPSGHSWSIWGADTLSDGNIWAFGSDPAGLAGGTYGAVVKIESVDTTPVFTSASTSANLAPAIFSGSSLISDRWAFSGRRELATPRRLHWHTFSPSEGLVLRYVDTVYQSQLGNTDFSSIAQESGVLYAYTDGIVSSDDADTSLIYSSVDQGMSWSLLGHTPSSISPIGSINGVVASVTHNGLIYYSMGYSTSGNAVLPNEIRTLDGSVVASISLNMPYHISCMLSLNGRLYCATGLSKLSQSVSPFSFAQPQVYAVEGGSLVQIGDLAADVYAFLGTGPNPMQGGVSAMGRIRPI